jgi:tetratricopeptide (TPR) repeat protein
MRATIAWSVALLTPQEQVLFRRLSVFVGGGTLEAIEAVCLAPEGAVPLEFDLLDGLGVLVDQSLMEQREEGGGLRSTVFHVIREFALEQLLAGGEAETLQRVHAEYYLNQAEQLERTLGGPNQFEARECLERDHDNLRAALRWSLEHQAAETAARICVALGTFWNTSGQWIEQWQWLTQTLRVADALPPQLHARLLKWAGYLTHAQGDYAASRAHLEEGMALFRSVDDAAGQGDILSWLAGLALDQEYYEQAEHLFDEALLVAREVGDRRLVESVMRNQANLPEVRGDYLAAKKILEEAAAIAESVDDVHDVADCKARLGWLALLESRDTGDAGAETLLQEALGVQQRLGDPACTATSLRYLGLLALERGDVPGALERLRESVALSTKVGSQTRIAEAQIGLGYACGAAGDLNEAEKVYLAGLHLERRLSDKQRIAAGFQGLAEIALARGNLERAARLLGAAAQALTAVGAFPLPLPPRLRAEREQVGAEARQQLGEAAWKVAFAAGAALSLDDAFREALHPI